MAGKEKGGINMVYKWKQERFPVKAQEAGEELERMQARNNGITPQIVVEESKPKDSTLHKCFEWDDTKAAGKFREQQARVLIANIITVRVEEDQEEIKPVRAFVNVTDCDDEPSKYISLETALNDENYKKQMIGNALKELKSFQQKYRNLKELGGLFDEINKITA
jgi:hypothetical protein